MIGLTLLFLLVVSLCVFFIVSHVRERNAIKALAVGQRFVSHYTKGDPWTNESDVYTIVEIKNGWVRASWCGIFTNYSARDFVTLKIRIS